MSQDLSKLSKAELLKRLEALEAQAAAPAPAPAVEAPAPAPATATIDVNALMQAVIALREAPAAPAPVEKDQTIYTITNVSGMALGIEVNDERTGLLRTFSLPKHGDFCKLTRGQVEQLREKAPHFFERGYVSVPGVIEDNPNVIRDYEVFMATIAFDDIDAKIEGITSFETLNTLFNKIEAKRFISTDEQGNPLTEKVDGKDQPVLREVKLEPRLRALETAVKHRIEALRQIKVHIDGK